MLNEKQLKNYADLVIKIGINLQKNQDLTISSPIDCATVARALAKSAYENGAYRVNILYSDEVFNRIKIDLASKESLADIPQWTIDSRNSILETKGAHVSISAGDPENFKGADKEKMRVNMMAGQKAGKRYFDAVTANGIRWCVVSMPTPKWAKKVFPQLPEAEAIDALWQAIAKSMRLDADDPVAEWNRHNDVLKRRAQILNAKNFEYLHYTNSLGTDLKVGLAEDHVWTGGCEVAQDGVEFTANLPTEEIFTAPHKDKVEGIVYSALPLVHAGNIIDHFSLTFREGRVVDFQAEKGYETLKNLIETDEGAHRLGEAALIGKNTPINQMGILFYNTLFDENASCHLALGEAYPSTVKNGEKMTEEERLAKGLNTSLQHVDFMVGTPDLKIDGIGYDGSVTPLFEDGEWIF